MVDILEKLISLEKLGSNPKVGYFQYFLQKKISGLKCNQKKKKKTKTKQMVFEPIPSQPSQTTKFGSIFTTKINIK